jgi:aryl-alcohol dehydrogenase-like predicted oxidoreductase
MFAPAATPKSRLGRYRLLAPTAGVKVSPLCLGAMNFGEGWYVQCEDTIRRIDGIHPSKQE